MELKDYYAIMGVKPTDDLKTIKTAYRRLARKYHPDVSKEPDAEARFKEVAEAWEVLSDEQRRAEYDQMWQHRNDPQFSRQFQHGDSQSFNAEDFDDIFSSIFGQHARQSRQRPATRGHDIEIEVAVFLEETLTEHKRTISYNLPVYNAFGMIEQEIPKTLNVKIPAGVGNGQRIRLKGQGTPGENGGPNGDLWLVIHIAPHPLFDIVGQDLEIVVPVSPWEAALGAKVTVPTLKESILLTIFVLPELHGKGIGRKIINTLEQDEFYVRATRIEIPASITATEFYRKFGYDYKNGVKELDEEHHYRLEKFKEVWI